MSGEVIEEEVGTTAEAAAQMSNGGTAPDEGETIQVNYGESELYRLLSERLIAFDLNATLYHGLLNEESYFLEEHSDFELPPEMRPLLWMMENKESAPDEREKDLEAMRRHMGATMDSVLNVFRGRAYLHLTEESLEPLIKVYAQLPEQFIPKIVEETVSKTTAAVETIFTGKDNGVKVDEPALKMLFTRDLREWSEKYDMPDMEQRFLDSVSLAVVGSVSDLLEAKTGKPLPYESHPKFARYFAEGAEIPAEFRANDGDGGATVSSANTSEAALDPTNPLALSNTASTSVGK